MNLEFCTSLWSVAVLALFPVTTRRTSADRVSRLFDGRMPADRGRRDVEHGCLSGASSRDLEEQSDVQFVRAEDEHV